MPDRFLPRKRVSPLSTANELPGFLLIFLLPVAVAVFVKWKVR